MELEEEDTASSVTQQSCTGGQMGDGQILYSWKIAPKVQTGRQTLFSHNEYDKLSKYSTMFCIYVCKKEKTRMQTKPGNPAFYFAYENLILQTKIMKYNFLRICFRIF